MICMFKAIYYLWLMYWRTFKICLEKYQLTQLDFLLHQDQLAWQAALKKTKVKLYILTDIDILLMVEKGIRVEICLAIYQCKN